MKPPRLFISAQAIEFGDNRVPIEEAQGLPTLNALLAALPDEVFAVDKLVVLIADGLLHPLRVTLEEKVKPAELPQYLLWKLKRYLPYSGDQTVLRYLPLSEENHYLTFALSKPWVEGLHAALVERGVKAGYIGGLCATLLENQKQLRDRVSLCFYEDFYLYAELDGAGHWRQFSGRRLPSKDDHGRVLDVDTLLNQDLAEQISQLTRRLVLLDFGLGQGLEEVVAQLSQKGVDVVHPQLHGPTLGRFNRCYGNGEVAF